jgi:transposase
MNNDLQTRLRDPEATTFERMKRCLEAADEIERLKADYLKVARHLEESVEAHEKTEAELAALRAGNPAMPRFEPYCNIWDRVDFEADDAGKWVKHSDALAALITERAKVEAMEKDAARYRWLLVNYARGDGYEGIDRALNNGEADTQLSPAIDAAIAATERGGSQV